MKKERQFLHDLYRGRVSKIPFIELFQNNKELRNELFKQYLKTDTEPDFSLYLNKHYTSKELEKGFEEARGNLPSYQSGNVPYNLAAGFVLQNDFEISIQNLRSKFHTLIAKNEIPEEFYKHSITRTPFIKKLEKIDKRIMDFNLYVTKTKKYNPKTYAKSFIKTLIHDLENIGIQTLTELILKDFMEQEEFNENRFDYFYDHKYDADAAKDKYRELTLYTNNIINDYLKNCSSKKRKIDIEFINDLRKKWGTVNFVFEKKEKNIVPEELTHEQLIRKNIIDDSIYRYYFLPTSRMLTDAEFQKMVNTGYVGERETFLTPYPFIICGAYFSRKDLVTKLSILNWEDEKPYLNGSNDLYHFEDLWPYFKEYSKGFESGYNEFENKCVKPYLPMYTDKDDFINKVFEYITKRIFFQHDWLNHHSGFVTEHANAPEGGKIVNAFEDGQIQGYFYKAWGIIFSSNNLFAPLFQEHLNTSASQKENKKTNSAKKNEDLKLEMYFESISKYKKIMEVLVKKGLIQEHTYLWKDEGKSNKKLLASLLKHLHSQGYYKNNKRIKNSEIVEVALNSFGWEISIDLVKKVKGSDFPYSYIPPSSTLK